MTGLHCVQCAAWWSCKTKCFANKPHLHWVHWLHWYWVHWESQLSSLSHKSKPGTKVSLTLSHFDRIWTYVSKPQTQHENQGMCAHTTDVHCTEGWTTKISFGIWTTAFTFWWTISMAINTFVKIPKGVFSGSLYCTAKNTVYFPLHCNITLKRPFKKLTKGPLPIMTHEREQPTTNFLSINALHSEFCLKLH